MHDCSVLCITRPLLDSHLAITSHVTHSQELSCPIIFTGVAANRGVEYHKRFQAGMYTSLAAKLGLIVALGALGI
jgi:hypothetical protein